MPFHKALIAHTPGALAETDVPTPVLGHGEVLVKVAYTALVPLDVEIGEKGLSKEQFFPFIPGFNLAGVVAAVGEGVEADVASVGDRVAGFALPTYGSRAKGAQQYAVLPSTALTKIPETLSLEDAVTIPDYFVCAWWTLTEHLKLPLTATPAPHQAFSDESFLIYGASSTTGQLMVQVLALFGCTRVIAVASRANHAVLRSLGASHVVDYHDADWAQQVSAANGGRAVRYAVDIIATETSLRGVAAAVDERSTVAVLLPMKFGQEKIVAGEDDAGAQFFWEFPPDKNPFPTETELGFVRTFLYDQNEYLKNNLLPKVLPPLLASGAIKPTARKVISAPADSLAQRVNVAFNLLRTNAVSGYKLVVSVQDL